jgi:hypothetical protein
MKPTKASRVSALSARLHRPLSEMDQKHLTAQSVNLPLLTVIERSVGRGPGRGAGGTLEEKAAALASRLDLAGFPEGEAAWRLATTSHEVLDALLESIPARVERRMREDR